MADVQMTITVVVSTKLGKLIDDAAAAEGRTRANYVRQLLERLHPQTPATAETKKGHK